MTSRNPKSSGFLVTELIVSLTVLAILMVGFALSLHAFAKFNRYQLVRQRCIAAAQAELDSISVTGEPVPEEDVTRLWPGLAVSTRESVGAGQWQGMRLVQVTAAGMSFRKEVTVSLSRYISGDVASSYATNSEGFARKE